MFYGEMTKNIFQLSSNMHLFCSSGVFTKMNSARKFQGAVILKVYYILNSSQLHVQVYLIITLFLGSIETDHVISETVL